MLYSHEVVLMGKYFRNNRRDPAILIAAMAILFANDTFSTASQIFMVYQACITNW